jgi:hypothetical protein
VIASRLAGLMSVGDHLQSWLLLDLLLHCFLDASVVTDATILDVCIFILLPLGGMLTNGCWRSSGER